MFSGTCKFPKIDFFRTPFIAPGIGLGDDLVITRVLEHPWGPTYWPLGPYSPSQGPPKISKICFVDC